MIFALFLSLIGSKARIYICDADCSFLHQNDVFSTRLNLSFNEFIKPYLKEREIVINLYSKENNYLFKLDLTCFNDKNKITLKNLHFSQSIKVQIKHGNLHDIQIFINPNHQILLPVNNYHQIQNLILYKKNMIKKHENKFSLCSTKKKLI